MQKVKVILIGAAFSADLHADGYARVRQKAQIAAIVDKDIARAKDLAARYGFTDCAFFEDYETAVKAVDCDVVDVCLPNFLHKDAALCALRDSYGLKDDISVSLLSRFQDVFLVEKTQEDLEAVSADICSVLELALQDFDAMRAREGEKLFQDVTGRARTIEALTTRVEERAPGIVADYRARLSAKMAEVLQNTQLDESRILTEAAVYADKVAVDEETVRLRSHLSQLDHMLAQEGPVGRKLDFLIQEFNREANTIGSKCNDIETAGYVVDIKAEIEKIREQIQNIE